MNLTSSFARQFLASIEPAPCNPTDAEVFLSGLMVKNLADFCETGRSILNEMREHGSSIEGLPSHQTLSLVQGVLKSFYNEKAFIPDDDYGQRPNWKVISTLPTDDRQTLWRLYRIIRRNIKGSEELLPQLQSRNKTYFSNNIDTLFHDVPFKDLIGQIKNFINSPYVPSDSQELIWQYCEALVDLILKEQEHLETIKSF